MTSSQLDSRRDRRCCQCGRVGVRGFKVIPEAIHPPTGVKLGPFTVCANDNACRKRWPRRDEPDAL